MKFAAISPFFLFLATACAMPTIHLDAPHHHDSSLSAKGYKRGEQVAEVPRSYLDHPVSPKAKGYKRSDADEVADLHYERTVHPDEPGCDEPPF